MIPFNGLMQVISGSPPTRGGHPGSHAGGNQGLSENEAAGAFPERVRQIMARLVSGGKENAGAVDLQGADSASDMPILDHLQDLLADERDPSDSLDQSGVLIDMSTENAMARTSDEQERDDWLTIIPPGIGQTLAADNGAGPPAGDSIRLALAAKENSALGGQLPDGPNHRVIQESVAGMANPTGQAVGAKGFSDPPHPNIRDVAAQTGFEKENNNPSPSASGAAGDQGGDDTGLFTQEGVSAAWNHEPKATEPPTRQQDPLAGPSRHSGSISTALADQKTASSEEDAAHSHGRARHGQPPRMALVDDSDAQTGKAADSVKVAALDSAKSGPSFQDTTKAMTADASINAADKPAADPTTPLSRTEAAAARTFQTTVMDQIVDKAALRSIHGRSDIQIRLKPEFLGNVQMNIATDKNQVVVRILTDQPAVKEIIETHLHQLKTELQNHGLTIDKFEVMVNPDAEQAHSRQQFAQLFKNNSWPDGRRQPREQNPETSNRSGDHAFDEDPPNRDGVNYFA